MLVMKVHEEVPEDGVESVFEGERACNEVVQVVVEVELEVASFEVVGL